MWVSTHRETPGLPENGWFVVENPIEIRMIWEENPYFFGNTNVTAWL